MALDELNNNETATKINGLDVLISDEVKGFAERSEIDYISGPHREGFTIGRAGRSGC